MTDDKSASAALWSDPHAEPADGYYNFCNLISDFYLLLSILCFLLSVIYPLLLSSVICPLLSVVCLLSSDLCSIRIKNHPSRVIKNNILNNDIIADEPLS